MPPPHNLSSDTPTPPPSPTGSRRRKRKSLPVLRQTLIDRLVRAGLTFILLGLAASQLPTDGHVMADTKTCSGSSQDMYRLTTDSSGATDPPLGPYASGSTITLYAFIYDKKSSSWKTFTPTLGTQTDINGSFNGNVYTGTTSNTTSSDQQGSVTVSGPGVTLTDTFTVVGTPVVAPTATPTTVSGTTASLSSGITYTGAEPLTYSWTGKGSAPFSFSPTTIVTVSTAPNPTVYFTGAGSYAFTVTVSDNYGFSQTGTVSGSVVQTPRGNNIAVSPSGSSSPYLAPGGSVLLTASLKDQFNNEITTFKWSATGGTVSSTGADDTVEKFTAGNTAGPYIVTACYDNGVATGTFSNSIQ